VSSYKRVCVVGALPHPIGGVSTYLSRLCQKVEVDVFLDLYPFCKKSIDGLKIKDYRVSPFKGPSKYFWLVYQLMIIRANLVVYNFSTLKALFPLLILPKFSERYHCVLHNGAPFLGIKVSSNIFVQLLLRKVDCFFSLNKTQSVFFRSNNINYKNYKSYVPIIAPLTDKVNNNKVILSGYPTDIYNFLWIEKIAPDYKNLEFDIYVYGEGYGEQAAILAKRMNKISNVRVYRDTNPDEFLKKLTNASYYIRLNSVDSFGIVVADSVNLGLKVLASNCCERYPGAYLFNSDCYFSFESAFRNLVNGNFLQLRSQKSKYDYSNGYKMVIEDQG